MSKAKIMVVEDEGIEALDIQNRLIGLGYECPEIVLSGDNAVQKAGEINPDLVLMDIMLHGETDGIAAAEQIQASLDIPIIFLTAYANEDTLQRAKITEPYGYIVKPFRERDLHITIDMALYKHGMEKKLREREKWFATTLRSIGDAVIATDQDVVITFINAVAQCLTGWSEAEALGRNLGEVFRISNRETHEPVESPVARVLRDGAVAGLANHTVLKTKDGQEIPIDDSAAPIIDDRGSITGVVLVFRDIKERERAEEELRRSEKRYRDLAHDLIRTNKELELFASMASHDLQEPLRKILVLGDRLKCHCLDRLDEKGLDYLARMERAAQRMRHLIDGILQLSQVTRRPLEIRSVDLTKILDEVHSDFGDRINAISGTVEIGDLPVIECEPVQMRQLFTNLITNALKFCNEPPRISITSRPVDRHKREITVRDNGIGFDEKYLDIMFNPFQQLHTRGEYEGIGLGLAICQRIVARHNGKITAKSVPGQGSAFIITLPEHQDITPAQG